MRPQYHPACLLFPKLGKAELQELADEWIVDLLESGGREKDSHDYGKTLSDLEYLIEKVTVPGDLIVDPFCGGGSVPAAAKKLNRRCLATEIDRTTALIARKRLSKVPCRPPQASVKVDFTILANFFTGQAILLSGLGQVDDPCRCGLGTGSLAPAGCTAPLQKPCR
jgi:hypothetical protein